MKKQMQKKLLSLLLLVSMATVFFCANPATPALGASGGGGDPWGEGITMIQDVTGLSGEEADSVLAGFLKWILSIFIILAFISFVVTGVMYLMAGANKGMADQAKSAVTYSIIALVVAFSAYIIISLIDDLLWRTA